MKILCNDSQRNMSLALVRHLCRTARHAYLPVVVVHHLPPPPLTRAYASKSKPKGIDTASFVPGSQQRFDSDETRTEYASAEDRMSTAVGWFRKEVAALETRATGRVTPALLAPVRVERSSGGGKSRAGTESVKLEEVATVGVKDGSVLIVTVFDEHVGVAFFYIWDGTCGAHGRGRTRRRSSRRYMGRNYPIWCPSGWMRGRSRYRYPSGLFRKVSMRRG